MSLPRLLITGAGGLLGHALCEAAANRWAVFALGRQAVPAVSGIRWVPAGITDDSRLDEVFDVVRPEAVIHVAAMSQPNACEQSPEASAAVNVEASIRIGARCAAVGLPMVFASSDLVFDGTQPPYGETDPVSPISVYGRHKAAAERQLAAVYPEATICRLPLLFGYAPTGGGFLGELLRTLSAGGRPTLFTDEVRTPVSTQTAAQGLLSMLREPGRTLHLGGREAMSRYQFGLHVAAIMKLPPAVIVPIHLGDLTMPAPRSPNVSLDSTLAECLGFDAGDFIETLQDAVAQYRGNLRGQSSPQTMGSIQRQTAP